MKAGSPEARLLDIEGKFLTYAQELLKKGRAEGQAKGRMENQVEVAEGLLESFEVVMEQKTGRDNHWTEKLRQGSSSSSLSGRKAPLAMGSGSVKAYRPSTWMCLCHRGASRARSPDWLSVPWALR